MSHLLLSVFSQPLSSCPGIVIMQLESGNHDLFLITALRDDKTQRQQNRFQNKKATWQDFEADSAINQTAHWAQTATPCSNFTTSKSSTLSICFVICFICITLDIFIFLQWYVWTVINNPLNNWFAYIQTQNRAKLWISRTESCGKWEQDPWEFWCFSDKDNIFLLDEKACWSVNIMDDHAFNCSQSGSSIPTLNH